MALKPTATGLEAGLAWEKPKLNCEHGGYVVVDGFVYMSQGVGWSCLELKSGEERWFGRGPGKGSMLYADGMLYCLSERGRMGLIEAKPEALNLVSMFDLPPGDGPSWTHPAFTFERNIVYWDTGRLLGYGAARRVVAHLLLLAAEPPPAPGLRRDESGRDGN